MQSDKPKTGLIMTGGGARAAYQVGVLKAVADILPRRASSPFQILCGTSAGAINASALATHAYNFRKSVQRIAIIWSNFHAEQVFRTDALGILRTSFNWFMALMSLGMSHHSRALSLLDRTPLQNLLEQYIRTEDIQHSIDKGFLHALSINASGYSSHQSVSFFHGQPELEPWNRFRRIGVRTEINVDHLMASSAIPFVFPPQKINREYFGDGSMRQMAPISPALHLGADKVMIIGNHMERAAPQHQHTHESRPPTIGQIAGHVLDSIFLDSLDADIERLERINDTVDLIPQKQRDKHGFPLRHIDTLVISPSQDIGDLAEEYIDQLPRSMRLLLRGIGAYRSDGSDLVSYLLFERAYTRRLIDLGYQDTMDKKHELIKFLDVDHIIQDMATQSGKR
ncbi:patatin-like phospholipase family protein [Thiohalophilus thiocyanatoxydans]|uniref:NTE family protein n=1 Tax=Thiohalophilus thiocyanatoxydans TaxID=381308 RepID=A0A4R8IP68_9GAMM|nr:patatin-like phospholipase family protein [Thiohalophilus thiocyanatoxydans]TDY00960.1 NTE family protein [Thiohalophilus thiocyanatoxydans]